MNAAQTPLIIPTERSSDGDPSFWASMPGWTVSEMTALLLGLNPEDKTENIRVYQYKLLRKLISRSVQMKDLSTPLEPRRALEWALSNGISIPDLLRAEVEQHRHIENWHERFIEIQDILPNKTTRRKLTPKLRATFQCVLLGIAKVHYEYDHSSPTTVAKKIEVDLRHAGLKRIKWKTIHIHLQKAFEDQNHGFAKSSI